MNRLFGRQLLKCIVNHGSLVDLLYDMDIRSSNVSLLEFRLKIRYVEFTFWLSFTLQSPIIILSVYGTWLGTLNTRV